MNANSCIEVSSVSEFLDAVKQIYCDQDHQLFYRGVSKVQYATPEHDHPGIYRNKNWIDNEDKMFYELTAKCPEYFKDCKTTFEHLVMMQHYGYPTRLLDITSNPLVALYFACGGLNGSNLEDGQLISYHIKKNDIRNYESDRVSLLSHLSRSKNQLYFLDFIINSLKAKIHYIDLNSGLIEKFPDSFNLENKHEMLIHMIIEVIRNNEQLFDNISEFQEFFNKEDINFPDDSLFIKQYVFQEYIRLYEHIKNTSDITSILEKEDYGWVIHLKIMVEFMKPCTFFENYLHCLKNEKYYFDTNLIDIADMRTIQCVLPKQNNPRLIAQQGAFLLFGFKDAVSDKTATPVVDPKMYGELCMEDENKKITTTQSSGQKAEIIIKGGEKQKILDELKILGISNSTMFPEIDNIANELKNQYMK